jgi:HEAT repeat protein
MRPPFRRSTLPLAAACAYFLSAAFCHSAELSQADRNEVQRVGEALESGSLPWPAGWTLGHAASEEGQKEVERIGYANTTQTLEAAVLKAGGWEKYKADVASLLKSKDVVVRGFAAVWLADLGDRAYTKDLLALLESNAVPTTNNIFPDSDRGAAATALGILWARDHSQVLAMCLRNKSHEIRAGAALGLGYMHAKEFKDDIARLLDDKEFRVVEAAISALAELGAKEYADRFSEIALRNDPLTADVALDALVRLGAKEQGPKIARLLKDDSYGRSHAIMALATLNCREYAKDFGVLIDDRDWLTRLIAMCALGIMSESEYAPKIAKRLKAEERSDRQAAAWSLIMMESKENAATAVSTYDEFDAQQSGVPPHFPASKDRQLQKRFGESLSRMKVLANKQPSK